MYELSKSSHFEKSMTKKKFLKGYACKTMPSVKTIKRHRDGIRAYLKKNASGTLQGNKKDSE